MVNYIIGEIKWEDSTSLQDRIFLFCIGGKCMSGKIKSYEILSESNRVQIEVNFIEPSYFDNIQVGNPFTIQEASRVLSEGVIREIG
jgi:hypothetical protein